MQRVFGEEAMENHKFYQNRTCEYFPCHVGADPQNFNCLFCYCPLYALGDNCGGKFCFTKSGIKDCSLCLFPHIPENYEKVLYRMNAVLELAKRKSDNMEIP